MSSISDKIERYLTSGDPHRQNLHLFKFINSFSIVGVTSLIVFGALHLKVGEPVIGTVELLCAAFGIVNVVVLRIRENTKLASSTILIIMLAVLAMMLVNGGLFNGGILWFYTFPALAFFMKGNREGKWWVALLYLEIIAGIGLAYRHPVYLPYTPELLSTLAASLFAVTMLVYFYQSIHEEEDALLRKRTKELLDYGWKEKAPED